MIESISEITRLTYKEAYEAVVSETDNVLNSAPGEIKTGTAHLAQARGKMIRAVSLLTCAIGKDDLISPDSVKLAAAIELLHLATLVHDDVIDNADTRRGIEALHRKIGKKNAVICGDYIFCLALQTAASINDKKKYSEIVIPDYMTRVCLGELRENINNFNLELSVYNYLKIISGKTAALFEAAFLVGYILNEEDKTQRQLYTRLGRYIGMIFQLTDDCVDYISTAESAGKPVCADFLGGVITLPLIFILKENANLREQLKDMKASGLSAADLQRLVIREGGLEFTLSLVKRYYTKAQNTLDRLVISDIKKSKLAAILDKALNGIKL